MCKKEQSVLERSARLKVEPGGATGSNAVVTGCDRGHEVCHRV